MNDERLGQVAGMWLRDIDSAPTDQGASVRQAMEQVRETRQVRDWWPIEQFHPKALIAASTKYETDPIPATNGHTPTVIRRTTSMLSPVKAITAGAVVFAIGSAFLIAQPFQQQGDNFPGVATDEPRSAPVEFSGTIICGDPVRRGASDFSSWDEGRLWKETRGDAWRQTFTMSDPRLEGEVHQSDDFYVYSYPGADGIETRTVTWVTYRIDNDEGAWQGSTVSLDLPGEPEIFTSGDRQTYVLIGEGGYEGLTAVFDAVPNADYRPCGGDAYGLIFEGDPATAEPFVAE